MKRVLVGMAGLLLVTAGCGGSGANPNEETFPGAPGSTVAAPTSGPTTKGGTDLSGGAGGLPSSYPGVEQFKKGQPTTAEAKSDEAKEEATKSEETRTGEAKSEEPKPETAPAEEPKAEEPKPEEPKTEVPPAEAPKPDASTEETKPEESQEAPKA